MPQRTATIESLPMAFALVKEMQADGLEWGEGYRPLGREALAEIIQGRMVEAVDGWLDSLDGLAMRDRRNGTYPRHLMTELGDIELSVRRTRRCPQIDHTEGVVIATLEVHCNASSPAVYASRRALPYAMQDSLPPGRLRLCPAGVEPAGQRRKVSDHLIPFPGLRLALGQFSTLNNNRPVRGRLCRVRSDQGTHPRPELRHRSEPTRIAMIYTILTDQQITVRNKYPVRQSYNFLLENLLCTFLARNVRLGLPK